mmetsp:Transcript_14054/g.33529  ORF Transcript_14054/g.33529 Transcript_14054/m.33529 type:complete len:106 (-) Transcript_14054:778-1095(-)
MILTSFNQNRLSAQHHVCGSAADETGKRTLLESMNCVPGPLRLWPSADVTCVIIGASTTCCSEKPRMPKYERTDCMQCEVALNRFVHVCWSSGRPPKYLQSRKRP